MGERPAPDQGSQAVLRPRLAGAAIGALVFAQSAFHAKPEYVATLGAQFVRSLLQRLEAMARMNVLSHTLVP